jgi:hypothetical protein
VAGKLIASSFILRRQALHVMGTDGGVVAEVALRFHVTGKGYYWDLQPQRLQEWQGLGHGWAATSVLLNTSAEFFDPNAMQLHTACSICFLLPGSGT